MAKIKIMSLNGENMTDLIPNDLKICNEDSREYWRAKLLAEMIHTVDADIVGLVEAPPYPRRTQMFVDHFLNGEYKVCQGEKRGLLGLAFLLRKTLNFKVKKRSKQQSLRDFKLEKYDADSNGIKETYSWWNRVPLEIEISGGNLYDKTIFILIHTKSKGAFIPGDLFAYERLSRANRMKLRAQADAVRKRLNKLVSQDGRGRVVLMGDMNDGPEFDVHSALLGGAFLEPVMGSIWDPNRIFYNTHTSVQRKDRWTIDFIDRVINPLEASRYGKPTELRSWIDHILVSPDLKDSIVKDSAKILHKQPRGRGFPGKFAKMRGTDHHPPYVTLDL